MSLCTTASLNSFGPLEAVTGVLNIAYPITQVLFNLNGTDLPYLGSEFLKFWVLKLHGGSRVDKAGLD